MIAQKWRLMMFVWVFLFLVSPLGLAANGGKPSSPWSAEDVKLLNQKRQELKGATRLLWETDFYRKKMESLKDPNQIAGVKCGLALLYGFLGELNSDKTLFDKAGRMFDELLADRGLDSSIQSTIRICTLSHYIGLIRRAETEKDFLRLQAEAMGKANKFKEECRKAGWDTKDIETQIVDYLPLDKMKKQFYSPEGRFLPYSERKRMQEEALKKEREKREQEAKKAGAPGGSGLTSSTLTKGGLRPAAPASGCGCGCGSDQPTSATKSAASCGGCGSGGASPKPASSPPSGGCGCGSDQPTTAAQPAAKPAESAASGGGCGCGSAQPGKQSAASSGGCGCGSGQPKTGTQPAAKPAGSSASSSGYGCGSPQPAPKPAGSSASGSSCGCGSPQPAAKLAESSASGGGCGCGLPQPAANPAPPKGADGQPAPRPGAIAQ